MKHLEERSRVVLNNQDSRPSVLCSLHWTASWTKHQQQHCTNDHCYR